MGGAGGPPTCCFDETSCLMTTRSARMRTFVMAERSCLAALTIAVFSAADWGRPGVIGTDRSVSFWMRPPGKGTERGEG